MINSIKLAQATSKGVKNRVWKILGLTQHQSFFLFEQICVQNVLHLVNQIIKSVMIPQFGKAIIVKTLCNRRIVFRFLEGLLYLINRITGTLVIRGHHVAGVLGNVVCVANLLCLVGNDLINSLIIFP